MSPTKIRYPSQFERFSPEAILPGKSEEASYAINTYDNSVFYNDYIVMSMIESVRQSGGCGALVYFSDHGEDVYDTSDRNLWHEEVDGTRPMYEIPFIVWLSPQYRRCYPERTSAVRANRDRKFMTDQLMPTLLDMAGLQCDSLDRSASLCSEKYVETPRLIGRIGYDTDKWWHSDARSPGRTK